MHTTEMRFRHLKVEDLEDVIDTVDGCIRHSKLEDAMDYVATYSTSRQIQSVCGKTDHKRLALVDSAIEELRATVGRIQAESATTNVKLNRAISLLRRARNSLVDINTFPEELLRAIFVWFSKADVAEKLRIANTCLRWREVCVAFPEFWADFTASDGTCGLIYEALSHSRGLPLTISVSNFDHHWPAVVLALDSHGDAVRTLSLCSESCGPLTEVLEWQMSFPCLRELHLAYQPQVGLMGTFEAEILPEAPWTSQLETVVLTNCRWPYSPSCYRDIKSLSLVCDTDTDHEPEHFLRGHRTRLCDALSGSPQLEDLTLYHPFMHADEVLVENHLLPPVSLPSLRSLRVCMAVEKTSALLSRLQTSVDTLETVILVLTPWKKLPGSHRPKPDFETLLALPRPTSLPMLIRLRSLFVSHGFRRIAGGFGATPPAMPRWDALRHGAEFPSSEPGLYVEFYGWRVRWYLEREAFSNLFASILEHYVLERLQTLRLERLWDPGCVMEVLRIAPCIQTLVFGVQTQPDKVVQAIVDRRGDSEGVEPLFLPELRVVSLVDIDLHQQYGLLSGLREAVKRLGLRCLSFEGCRSRLNASELVEQFRGDCTDSELEVRCVDLFKLPKHY